MNPTSTTNPTKLWLSASGALILVTTLVLVVFWKRIPPEIPWFYSLPWGEEQLMDKSGLVWILGTVAALVTGTSFLPKWTKSGDVVVEKTIMMTVFFGCLLLVIGLVKVLVIFIDQ